MVQLYSMNVDKHDQMNGKNWKRSNEDNFEWRQV